MEIKLNLIPKYKKEEIAESDKLKLVLRWEIEITFILIIFFMLLLSLNYILQFNLDAATSELESKQSKDKYEKISEFDNNFKIINTRVSADESIQKDQLYWSNLFQKLSDTIPDGIIISKMANKNYKVFLAGSADTRDTLISLKDRLSQESCFTDINLPLSNLVSKDNIDFQIDFNIKEECVKNK